MYDLWQEVDFLRRVNMKKSLYHQTENTFNSEFSTYVYDNSALDFESPHFHKNFEFLMVIKGCCQCSVGGQEYLLEVGDAIFVSPFQIHSFSIKEESAVRRVTFHDHLILTLSQTLDGRRPKTCVFHPSESLMRFFLDKMEEFFGKDSGLCIRIAPHQIRMQVKGCLYMLGGELLDRTELVPTPTADAVTMAVAQYIAENFKRDITLRDVAREKGYNYQYLSRIFNRVIGMNFKKMLNQYRLEHAYAMLQDTDLPISRICFESGFQSIRSFDQVCRDTFHKSPKEVRRDSLG